MDDATTMGRAISNADEVRAITSPNPWVGAVVTATDESMFDGATHPPGGPHAEVVALTNAGAAATGATLTVTLEPCVNDGHTPPCTDAIVGAGVARVVVGIEEPDPRVAGLDVAGEPVLHVLTQPVVGDQLGDLRAAGSSLGVPLRRRRSIRHLVAARRCVAAQLPRDRRRVPPDPTSDLADPELLGSQDRDLLTVSERQVAGRHRRRQTR